MDNVYTCMLLCYIETLDDIRSKFPHNKKRFACLKGWKPIINSKELNIGIGFFGAAYYRKIQNTHEIEIIIAIRGTYLIEPHNIIADIAIAKNEIPEILNPAFDFVGELLNTHIPSLLRKYHGFNINKITYSGFSLGGFIAMACASEFDDMSTNVITFDSPGSLDIDDLSMSEKVINIFKRPNMINTCGKHVGLMFEELHSNNPSTDIDFDVDLHKPLSQQATNEFLNIFYNHNLIGMITFFEQGGKYRQVREHPVAINIIRTGPKPLEDTFRPGCADDKSISVCKRIADNILKQSLDAKDKACWYLWDSTQRIDENGQLIGVIGIKHKRSNIVVYED